MELLGSDGNELAMTGLDEFLPRFGLTSFRPGQRDVIQAVIAGQDCLCIMPTGGGKSLCYQLPAIARKGLTLVVSPLIALMKDQVDSLTRLGLRATYINSSLPAGEQHDRMYRMSLFEYDLVYIAPERLRNLRFQEIVRQCQVNLLAVDEAHCISEWGHDFRPDYSRLGDLRELLGLPQTIALTATATPAVRKDVIMQLRLREPQIFVTGFARPNLRFEGYEANNDHDKSQDLLKFLSETPGAGIIYASTRKRCEEIVQFLGDNRDFEARPNPHGSPATPTPNSPRGSSPRGSLESPTKSARVRRVGLYHAGLDPDTRRSTQDEFMQGNLDVIVATNAFGMGINKTNLRFVVHYNLPGSLEAYYQEAGRAGRDGLPSRCRLLFANVDKLIQEYFIENNYPPQDVVRKVYEFLRIQSQDPIELTQQEIKDQLNLDVSSEAVGACEKILEKAGALLRLNSQQNHATVKIDSDLPTLVDLLPRNAHLQHQVVRALERIVGEQRFEWVSVPMNRLLKESGVERASFNDAVRELRKLKVFDYVPPFRGRAVHLLKPLDSFRQLNIDFTMWEKRKAAEYAKLDRMYRYASSRRCRQWEFLDYFGDPALAVCQTCDNCGSAPVSISSLAQASVVTNPVIIEGVRIALSGVARSKGRFGLHLVAKMLCGSRSAKIIKSKLDSLSTFGLLSVLTQNEAIEFLGSLLEGGLLQQDRTDRELPRICLSDRGRAVMHGPHTQELNLLLSPVLSAKLAARKRIEIKPSLKPEAVRPEAVSAVEQRVAARNSALAEQSGSAHPEFGAPQIEKRGRETGQDGNEFLPKFYWTWRLLSDGYSAMECRQIRGYTPDQILDDLARALDEGWEVNLNWVLSQGQISQLESIVPAGDVAQLRPIIRELPSDLGTGHLNLYLKHRRAVKRDI